MNKAFNNAAPCLVHTIGAVTWGALDAYLDHQNLAFEGLSGSNPFTLRIFRETEWTVGMLLTSACLPKHHTACMPSNARRP